MKWSKLYIFVISVLLMHQATAQAVAEDSMLDASIKKMTLEEKLGQIILPSYILLAQSTSDKGVNCPTMFMSSAKDDDIICSCGLDLIAKFKLGAVLTGGGPVYSGVPPTLENWQKVNRLANLVHANQVKYRTACLLGSDQAQVDHSSGFKDPLLLIGNDAVHGNEHVQGAVIFPHNIGLGATRDPDSGQKMGQLVAQDSLISGFNWLYAPCVANAQDIRWGRTYESFSQDPDIIRSMGQSFIEGIQQTPGALESVKHFAGDGATQYGHDEGDDNYQKTYKNFWDLHGQGYEGALKAGVRNLMVSYSAIDGVGTRMHMGGKYGGHWGKDGLLNKFKQRLSLTGFAVSDWNGATRAAGIDKLNLSLDKIYAKSLNAGVDMFMIAVGDQKNPTDPNGGNDLNFSTLQEAYNQGFLKLGQDNTNEARLNDAVKRILKVKKAMGQASPNLNYSILQEQERQLALKLAQESLVLLKNGQNNDVIPVDKTKIKTVLLIGDVDDIGVQNGGWTINWQGQYGNDYFGGQNPKDAVSSGATTLLKGIQDKLPGATVVVLTQNDSLESYSPKDTIAIALLNEPPYAEYMGDIGQKGILDPWNLYGLETYNPNHLPNPQSTTLALNYTSPEQIKGLQHQGIKVVTVIYSGRPVIVDTKLPDALIAAFLPGTLGGQAVADAIFGDYRFCSGADGKSNRLSFNWPSNMKEVETGDPSNFSLYQIGHGHCTKTSNQPTNVAE